VISTLFSDVKNRLGRRTAITALVATLAVIAVAATPQLLGSRLGDAFTRVGDASPSWLWLAALCFLASIVASAGSWREALRLCGARLGFGDACMRYGTGCLVNSFTPARLGDAVRIALFSRSIDHRDRLWTTGGAFAATRAANALVVAGLVGFGAAVGALPLWPVLLLAGLGGLAVLVAVVASRRHATRRVAHALDAFRALGREPLRGLRILAWLLLGAAARVGAAAAIASAVGVHSPFAAALIMVPALDLASALPLTPGNVGVTSGAVTMALQAHGVGLTEALSTGIAFHAVETCVGVLFGLCSVLSFARPARRWTLIAAGATASLLVAGAFSATVLAPLV
jgi:uncharacterized membrane protein YbhN (UPF0104 family)